MALKRFTNITSAELSSKGVVALADKPNLSSSYGVGGLSPTDLKLWFDQLAKFIAEKINIIQDALSSDDAAGYMKLDITGLYPEKEANENFTYSLQDLISSFVDGKFAGYVKVYEKAADKDTQTLQAVLNKISANLSSLNEKSDENILDHIAIRGEIDSDIVSHNTSVTAHNDIRQKITNDISSHNTNPNAHKDAMALKFDKSDVMENFTGEDKNNKAKVPSAKALNEVIATINNSINGVDGKVDIAIKNVEYNSTTGVIIFTKTNGDTITYNLPSEKILKSGASYYDDDTRTLHLILMDDSDIIIDVSNLVDEYYGDDGTVVLVTENGKKKFKIKDSYKQTLDGYGTTLEQHTSKLQELDEGKVNKTDIADNLTTDDATKVASARQAKALKAQLDSQNTIINGCYNNVSYDNQTGTLNLIKADGTSNAVNLPMESFVKSASFDSSTNIVTLVVANGENVEFDLSALIDYYYGDGESIEVYKDANDNYKQKIRVKSTYLDSVKNDITGLGTRMTKAESDIKLLERIDEIGSIGRADNETLFMDETTGSLTVKKIALEDGTILDIKQITRTAYDALTSKSNTTLYLISDNGTVAIALGGNYLYSGGVKDTETNNNISFRVITKSAYDGLTTKENNKLYIINNNGALSFAYGNIYLDTGSEELAQATKDIVSIKLAHQTLSGGNAVAIFNNLTVSGITITSGTLLSSERCIQC